MSETSMFVSPWLEHGLEDPDEFIPSTDIDNSTELWRQRPDYVQLTDEAILEPLLVQFGQIRSRARVRDLAEVFTNKREIDSMLDLISPAFFHLDTKFLEPAAGNGNFLLEILARKLVLVSKVDCTTQEQYEHKLLRAIASIYAVDISPENVDEARKRLAHALINHFILDAPTILPTDGFLHAAALILGVNIVAADSLNRVSDIEICEWVPTSRGRFQRIWSPALVPPQERDLFWMERKEDIEPVHYSQLVPEGHEHDIHLLKPGVVS